MAIDAPRTGGACCGMTVIRLDLTGLNCPLPALRTRKVLKSLAPGDRLEVRCTDPLAAIDIPHLVGATGDRLEGVERSERDIVFLIEKSGPSTASRAPHL
jgi:tRNA 2-thiouridine synthesizing protein A